MMVIGVGCGPGMMTQEAIKELAKARTVYGSKRCLELVQGHLRKGAKVVQVDDFAALDEVPENAVLLSTGDPMLAGLGHRAERVIPGISSLQAAYARLGAPLENTVIMSAQGRYCPMALKNAAEEVLRGRNVFLLADPTFSVPELAGKLASSSPECRIAVCERLGYPDERVQVGTALEPPETRTELFVVIAGEWA
jgi:cobalt-precorrin-7 (C5)-methyltransferase